MHGYQTKEQTVSRANPHGRVRGIVVDPRDIFDLMRDCYSNVPIPKDAKFEGIQMQKKGRDSYIAFYFSTPSAKGIVLSPSDINFDPLGAHCITLTPQHFLNILKPYANGTIPSDAEATGLYINQFMTFICVEAQSDKFPSSLADKMPMIHLRYEEGQIFSLSDTGKVEREQIV